MVPPPPPIYIRVKRKNQTIFLYADASEKVADLKGKLAKINEKSADELALIFNDAKLDNDKTVGDYKIENDQVVYLVYKKDGSDEFEEVDIQKPKPAEESEPKE
ncbi:ubiquitin family protein [Acanthamoeba castellanii str. Neff]|uniref:Ubiquitin family protein n=1 Tax=Acanthamoeba castellanii (strain ATCC 30010 / Neff) TaxID=1257118 RepID=L8GP24_ACACF|nr:ubiquitin family protein [Acanthamoeba castellanii str. Neff]ELR14939.1 ubiquitin family protein [Acanthamoeba castellanii str. Neff]